MKFLRLVAVTFLVVWQGANGYKIFQAKLPNGENVGVEGFGHDQPGGGGPNNDFGLDFIASMFKWTKEFCEKDSDGDGQTNGQEMGDPCCEFVHRKEEKVRWTVGVSHPGDAKLTSDPKLWEGIVCGADTETEEQDKEPKVAEAEEVEEVMEMQLEAQQELNVGAPIMKSSVMMSAAALTVLVVYAVAMRMGRRSSRNLPIFRQRRGPM